MRTAHPCTGNSGGLHLSSRGPAPRAEDGGPPWCAMHAPTSPLPPVDLEIYVPAAITVVRRSSGWPGMFLQERRGDSGAVNYPAGIRQHVVHLWLTPLAGEIIAAGATHRDQRIHGVKICS